MGNCTKSQTRPMESSPAEKAPEPRQEVGIHRGQHLPHSWLLTGHGIWGNHLNSGRFLPTTKHPPAVAGTPSGSMLCFHTRADTGGRAVTRFTAGMSGLRVGRACPGSQGEGVREPALTPHWPWHLGVPCCSAASLTGFIVKMSKQREELGEL